MRLGRACGAVVRFWVDFVIGDDWTVAAVVAACLLATWVLVRIDLPTWWLLPAGVVVVTSVSLRRAVKRDGRTR